ncbi:hypothetical protein CXB51_036992 [Gossypium anomalum]|uniref:G protein gamma domain-containing protein n=1 Tax=Gossypium anomalum TaxID=47600 RepID=A0A8J6CEB2_9ROSI|nr:hypothetical protein CXB51_036992 [Gossypium anomalum]
MAARSGGSSSSSVPTLPPPCPRSPPEYPDLYGKRREAAKTQMLEREISFLEEELKSVEDLQPVSRFCKEVTDFVMANSDPLIPTSRKNRKSCRFWKWLWYQFLVLLYLLCINLVSFLYVLATAGSGLTGFMSFDLCFAICSVSVVIAIYATAAHAFAAYVNAGAAVAAQRNTVRANAARVTCLHVNAARAIALHVNAAHATAIRVNAARATAIHVNAARVTVVHVNAAVYVTAVHVNAAHATVVHVNAAVYATAVLVNAAHATAVHVNAAVYVTAVHVNAAPAAQFRNGDVARFLNLLAAKRSRVAGTVAFFNSPRAQVAFAANGNVHVQK